MTDTPAARPEKKTAPWRGRPRTNDPKSRRIAVRLTDDQLVELDTKAAAAGLKVGGYLRTLALGSAGPRSLKRPHVEREMLAQVLGGLGKLGSNANQIAKAFNSTGRIPTPQELIAIEANIAAMRTALMGALGHGD